MDLIWWVLIVAAGLAVMAALRGRKHDKAPPPKDPEIVRIPSRRAAGGDEATRSGSVPPSQLPSAPPVRTPPLRPVSTPARSPAPPPVPPPQPPRAAPVPRPKAFTEPMARTAFSPLVGPLDPRSQPAPAKQAIKGIRWVSRGIVEVGGVSVTDPLAYVGTPASRPHNSVLDPALPVGRARPFHDAPELPYWPSYCGMTPDARATYLAWLAGGRKAPGIQIGYVFVHLYGLEWRALAERAVADLPDITAEIVRLLALYGGNGSFRSYAHALLDAIHFLKGEVLPLGDEVPAPFGYKVPLSLRAAIGSRVAAGRAVPFDLIFQWYLQHETTSLRTPARRAFPEFRDLCRARFAAAWGEGMLIKPPKGVLSEEYSAASGNFVVTLKADLPNVARLTAPIRKMADIAEAATDALDRYSRLLGRRPDARGTLEAAALLPPEIRDAYLGAEGAALRARLLGEVASGPVLRPLTEVAAALALPLPDSGRLRKDLAQTMAAALEAMGCGVEPDVRCGGRPPAIGEEVVLFPLPAGAAVTDGLFGVAYRSAVAILTVTAAVMHSDAAISEAEETHLTALVEDFLHLTDPERRRLQAHVRRLLATGADLAAARAAIKAAPEDERRRMARFALAAASADGVVAPGEVRMLEKLYRELGLDPGDLYGHLHAAGATARDEPVVVREAAGPERVHAIPPPPSARPAAAGGVALDLDFLDRVRDETRQVSGLLREIFVDEEPPPDTPPAAEPAHTHGFTGLDAAHGALLTALVTRDTWRREDFEAACALHRLLPDGALETINEWSFDTYGDPLLEEDDDITVSLALLGEAVPVPA